MSRLLRRKTPLRLLRNVISVAFLCVSPLVAEVFDYAKEPRFENHSLTVIQGEMPLASALWLIGRQTGLKWDDLPPAIPLDAKIVLETGSGIPLPKVLTAISAQVPVVFSHDGEALSARVKTPDDTLVLPPAVEKPAAPASDAVASSEAAPAAPAPETPAASGLTLPDFNPMLPDAARIAEVTGEKDEAITLEKFTIQEAAGGKNSVVDVRQKASIAVDMLTASDFSKFIASDVADISVRMPGISTTSKGTFAVVRGLAERYNPVMLDGIVLPSTDPERQSPELDIFPTRLVDAIVIAKTYEPSLPGTASGAGIDLRAKPLPSGRYAQFQVGIKADEAFLRGEKFLGSNRTGIWDYFSYGVKDREGSPDTNKFKAYIGSPNTVTNIHEKNFPMGGRFSVAYEDRIALNNDTGRAIGYGISFGYDRSASSEEGERFAVKAGTFNFASAEPNPSAAGNMREGVFELSARKYRESELETRFGLLANLGYAFNDQHQLAFAAFWSQIGIDQHSETTSRLDYDSVSYPDFDLTRTAIFNDRPEPAGIVGNNVTKANEEIELYYRQRQLYNVHLSGEHDFGGPWELKANWVVARVGASQLEPEYLSFAYSHRPGAVLKKYNAVEYTRYWRETKEQSKVGRFDIQARIASVLEGLELKTGAYVDRTTRIYSERNIVLPSGAVIGAAGQTRQEMIDELALGNFQPQAFSTNERPTFSDAERRLSAGYVSAGLAIAKDRSWIDRLDVLIGLRYENFRLESSGRGQVGNATSGEYYGSLIGITNPGFVPPIEWANFSNPPVFLGLVAETKSLPSLAINYSPIKGLTFRAAASKTTARPSFREMGSYFTVDRVADEYVHGNKDLKTSDVSNLDFRVEYFLPKSKDLVALSMFRKNISNPIERVSLYVVIVPGSVATTFTNNSNDAELRGLEFEFAKSLRFLGGPGKWFSVGGNTTLIDASVNRDPRFESAQILSSGIADERQLFDQPRWIANANTTFDYKPLGFSATLTYFAISEVLQQINKYTWDTYTAQRARWDLSLAKKFGNSWQLRFQASNLSDPERKRVADPENTNEEIVYRRYKDGRSYSLSLAHEF